MHTDLRDDNFLLDDRRAGLLCDWNWPVVGAAWLDSLFLLIGPRGDGLDVEAVIADAEPLLRDVPAEHIDSCSRWSPATSCASATSRCRRPRRTSASTSAWQGDVCWAWLCERRGWA